MVSVSKPRALAEKGVGDCFASSIRANFTLMWLALTLYKYEKMESNNITINISPSNAQKISIEIENNKVNVTSMISPLACGRSTSTPKIPSNVLIAGQFIYTFDFR